MTQILTFRNLYHTKSVVFSLLTHLYLLIPMNILFIFLVFMHCNMCVVCVECLCVTCNIQMFVYGYNCACVNIYVEIRICNLMSSSVIHSLLYFLRHELSLNLKFILSSIIPWLSKPRNLLMSPIFPPNVGVTRKYCHM